LQLQRSWAPLTGRIATGVQTYRCPTYDLLNDLPTPITAGRAVPVDGPEGFGCVVVGDITVECSLALVESDGNEVARLTMTGTQRGPNGYDGALFRR